MLIIYAYDCGGTMTAIYAGSAAMAAALAAWAGAVKLTQQPPKGWRLWLCVGLCACVGMVFGYILSVSSDYVPYALRMAAALVALTGATVCDWREKRIPNLFPLAILAASGAACVLDMLLQPAGIEVIAGSLISGVVVFLVMLLFRGICYLILHQAGIGWGDIKLLATLGCLVGLNVTISTILFGQLAAMVAAILLLAAHKVGIKDGICFAPFLYIGFIITICFGSL